MNKSLFGIGIVGVIILVGFVIRGSTIDYIATVDDEVTKLETELSDIETAVSSGNLTTGEASQAHKKIVNRLDTINSSVQSSQGSKLNDAQRMMLLDGLERLKTTLIKYQATLQKVEDVAIEESDISSLETIDQQALPEILNETIEVVEGYAADVVGLPIKEEGGNSTLFDEIASTTDDSVSVVDGDESLSGTSTPSDQSIEELEDMATSTE